MIFLNFRTTVNYLNLYKNNFNLLLFIYLIIFFLFIFGSFINSYISTFFPISERYNLFLFLMIGCIPFCCFIQFLSMDQSYSFLYTQFLRLILILSIIISIFLKFENVFLLFYSILLLLLFFIFFGSLGNYINKKYNNFISIGIVNGLVLASCFSSAIPTYIP